MYQITEFRLIDECLYLQRMHDRNTQRDIELDTWIQQETVVPMTVTSNPNTGVGRSSRAQSAVPWSHRSQAIGLSGRGSS